MSWGVGGWRLGRGWVWWQQWQYTLFPGLILLLGSMWTCPMDIAGAGLSSITRLAGTSLKAREDFSLRRPLEVGCKGHHIGTVALQQVALWWIELLKYLASVILTMSRVYYTFILLFRPKLSFIAA